jgi:hypothetical protein
LNRVEAVGGLAETARFVHLHEALQIPEMEHMEHLPSLKIVLVFRLLSQFTEVHLSMET